MEPAPGSRLETATQQRGWKNLLTSPSCLGWILAALVFVGGIGSLAYWATSSEDPSPSGAGTGAGTPATSASASAPTGEIGCADVTDQFRQFGRSRNGAGWDLVLNRVDWVCWQPAGELRLDVDIPADVEAASSPMTWLCAAASDFIASSGREWKGFTAYSAADITAGEAFLAGREPGAACHRP